VLEVAAIGIAGAHVEKTLALAHGVLALWYAKVSTEI
jgi:hypothetical protein